MSRHEYLATKLVRGSKEGRPRTTWWPRHSKAMTDYLSAASDDAAFTNNARSALLRGFVEWDLIVPGARKGLMGEHTRLETALIRAAVRREVDAIGRLGDMLYANVCRQAESFAIRIHGFPEARLRRLLDEHVSLFAGSVRWRVEGNLSEFEAAEGLRRANALALAGFTAEWL